MVDIFPGKLAMENKEIFYYKFLFALFLYEQRNLIYDKAYCVSTHLIKDIMQVVVAFKTFVTNIRIL